VEKLDSADADRTQGTIKPLAQQSTRSATEQKTDDQMNIGSQRQAASMNNMKKIMLAMMVYASPNMRFPPAFKADKDGNPLLSWRVLILPKIDQGDLYKEFHLDEPWTANTIKKLIARMPAVYKSPSGKAGRED